jgi:hypothetical protein
LLPIPVFAISASHTDGSGESFIFAKKVILASGVYVNLNDWLQVSHVFFVFRRKIFLEILKTPSHAFCFTFKKKFFFVFA